jgi:hypothetical protein
MNPVRSLAIDKIFDHIDTNHLGKVHYSELSINFI